MRRGLGLCCSLLASFGVAAATVPVRVSAEGASSVSCARTDEGVPTASASEPCWEAIRPYPFGGSEAEGCPAGAPQTCYLTVTSMAFRAWNFGLAATTPAQEPSNARQYGVWTFNGTRWLPDPTFPGSQTCPGHIIVWGGKLDYWLFGTPSGNPEWPVLCRFDGINRVWEALPMPKATLAHLTLSRSNSEHPVLRRGGLTSGACLAWNNCWFFGSYGVVVHWNGERLSDATPDPSQRSLQGEYTDAVTRQDPAGSSFGVAVGATSEFRVPETERELLPAQPGGAPPPEMFGSSGGPFAPLPLVPPTTPQQEDPATNGSESGWTDPYRTDLVAADFDSEGQGWVAGNPAGLRANSCQPPLFVSCAPSTHRRFSPPEEPQPSPLLAVSLSAERRCLGPPEGRFAYTPSMQQISKIPAADEGAFLWSSIAVIPGSGEGLAGGLVRPPQSEGPGPNEDGQSQPVIARVSCEGATAATRFRVEDPTARDYFAPGDREGYVTALAANAPNDAWAATSAGSLTKPPVPPETINGTQAEEPHLYRLTNGLAPEAPAGNAEESRPLPPEELPPPPLEPPPPEAAPLAPVIVTQTQQINLKPGVYGLRSKLHHNRGGYSLYLSFKLRRPVTIGAEGLRRGRVVAEARPRYFSGPEGVLVLKLDRKHWPTKVRFIA